MTYWIIGILYAAGAIGTGLWNVAMIAGPINYPLAILRNAVFWPIMLPVLIALNQSDRG